MKGELESRSHVLNRGGSRAFSAGFACAAYRSAGTPACRSDELGLRLIRRTP